MKRGHRDFAVIQNESPVRIGREAASDSVAGRLLCDKQIVPVLPAVGPPTWRTLAGDYLEVSQLPPGVGPPQRGSYKGGLPGQLRAEVIELGLSIFHGRKA
jgi:hypothetical protein